MQPPCELPHGVVFRVFMISQNHRGKACKYLRSKITVFKTSPGVTSYFWKWKWCFRRKRQAAFCGESGAGRLSFYKNALLYPASPYGLRHEASELIQGAKASWSEVKNVLSDAHKISISIWNRYCTYLTASLLGTDWFFKTAIHRVELLLESCFLTTAAFLGSHVGKRKWMAAQTPYLQGKGPERWVCLPSGV